MSPRPSSPGSHPPEDLQHSTVPESRRPSFGPSNGARVFANKLPMAPPPLARRLPPRLGVPPPTAKAAAESVLDIQRNPLRQLQNQAKRLTQELQELLDAQSYELMRASGGGESVDEYHRQRKSRPSLQQARAGIMRAMEELAAIKLQEVSIYSELGQHRKEQLSIVERSMAKMKRLRKQIEEVNNSTSVSEADELRTEAAGVMNQIQGVRQQLAELEGRYAAIQAKLRERDSAVESRSAPYKSSLEAVTKRLSSFLSEHFQSSPTAATETWETEAEEYTSKMDSAEKEREALDDGQALWSEVLEAVSGFEDLLRETLRNADGKTREESGRIIRTHLERVTKELEDMTARAESEGWNLLVAAIGAELQAFKEAGEVLKRSFPFSRHAASPGIADSDDRVPQELLMNPEPEASGRRDYSPLDD